MTGFTELAATGPVLLALGVCVLAGLVSFASPCVVPLVPGYLSYLAAVVGADEDKGHARLRVTGAAVLFVAGFTVVFLLGVVAVLGLTTTLIVNQLLLERIGGVITILMGLVFIGLFPPLQRQVRFTPQQVSTVAGAPLLGAVFAIGWTPCLGPTLTGVIVVATADDGATIARGVAWRGAGDRVLPGPGNPVRAVGLRIGVGGAGDGLAAPPHPGDPDLRWRAPDRRRPRVGHRAVE